jgi:CRISPR-associated protein Cmr6
MEQKKTIALRPVSREVNKCLGDIPSGSFNFGLYFNKWLCVVDGESNNDSWKRGEQWSCSMSDLTELRHNKDMCHPNVQLENLSVSIAMFNGAQTIFREVPYVEKDKIKTKKDDISVKGHWNHKSALDLMKSKHVDMAKLALSYSKLGYVTRTFEAELQSSLVIGLGNEHPTEKGFLFEWNMGIPFIPATSVKGVVRLAATVNRLNEFDQDDLDSIDKYLEDIRKDDALPDFLRDLFGTGGDRNSFRGKVIFLDAYPATMPKLQSEIMNCHYPDYLNTQKTGPTEDQSPNPQKYWSVQKQDRSGNPLKFVFRMLLSPEIASDSNLCSTLDKALESAMTEHGFGAKTAVGHGRFGSISIPSAPGSKSPDSAVSVQQNETWEKARLVYDPGRKEITATDSSGLKKAITKDLSIVPKSLEKKLLNKPKNAVANIQVELKGSNYYAVLKIDD